MKLTLDRVVEDGKLYTHDYDTPYCFCVCHRFDLVGGETEANCSKCWTVEDCDPDVEYED